MQNELKIFNGTPHAVTIVSGATFNPAIRKFSGGQVVMTIPSNGMLNAKMSTIELPSINGIPCFGKSFEGVDALPEGFDIYIVSALFSSAMQKEGADMSKIYTIADPVMSEDGNTFIGCRGICPAF
jgi:hypothetical protein